MKVCMITSFHSPKDDRIFFKQAKSLQNNGFEVSILCLADENGKIKDMSGKVINANNEEEIICDGIQIICIKKQSALFQKILHKFARGKCWQSFIEKAKEINADVYHAHEPQTAFIGLKIQSQTKAKLIYDAHEPWIFSRSVKEGFLKILCLSKLKNIISANQITQQALLKENLKLNTEVIFNCSPSFFEKERKEKNEIIICHEGSLWFNRGLKLIVETLIILKTNHPKFKFRIIGDVFGDEREYLLTKIKENNLQENVEITGWLAYKDVPKSLAECSIGIITNTEEKRNTMAGPPNKLFNYMTLGLAVLSVDLLATTQIIQETNCGIILQKRDAPLLAKELIKLLNDKTTLSALQQKSSIAAEEKYNWESEANKLFQFYRSLQ